LVFWPKKHVYNAGCGEETMQAVGHPHQLLVVEAYLQQQQQQPRSNSAMEAAGMQ